MSLVPAQLLAGVGAGIASLSLSNRLLNWEEPEEQEPFVTLGLLLHVQLSAYTGVSQGSFGYRRQKPPSKQPKLEGFYRLMNLKNPRRLSES